MRSSVLCLAFWGMGVLPVCAQVPANLFDQCDANRDGVVTADEVPAEHKALFERLLAIAGRQEQQQLNKPLFQAALKVVQSRPAEPSPEPSSASSAAGPAVDPELFARLDRDGDGLLTRAEIGPDQEAWFDRLVRRGDRDGDGKLSAEEFRAALRESVPPRAPLGGAGFPGRLGGPQGAFREMLQRMDTNRDGKLSKEEAPPPLRERFEQLDRDGDGLLSLQELAEAGPLGRGGRPPETASAPPPAAPSAAAPPPVPGTPPSAEQDRRTAAAGGLFAILDTDGDGQLSTPEIIAAGTVLWSLDRNRDGRLTPDEIFGNPPRRAASEAVPASRADASFAPPRRPTP